MINSTEARHASQTKRALLEAQAKEQKAREEAQFLEEHQEEVRKSLDYIESRIRKNMEEGEFYFFVHQGYQLSKSVTYPEPWIDMNRATEPSYPSGYKDVIGNKIFREIIIPILKSNGYVVNGAYYDASVSIKWE